MTGSWVKCACRLPHITLRGGLQLKARELVVELHKHLKTSPPPAAVLAQAPQLQEQPHAQAAAAGAAGPAAERGDAAAQTARGAATATASALDVAGVQAWLRAQGFGEFAPLFAEHEMDGAALDSLAQAPAPPSLTLRPVPAHPPSRCDLCQHTLPHTAT